MKHPLSGLVNLCIDGSNQKRPLVMPKFLWNAKPLILEIFDSPLRRRSVNQICNVPIFLVKIVFIR